MICNTLKDWQYIGWFALGSMICTGIKDLYHCNIGLVSSSLFLKIENKYPDFVDLFDKFLIKNDVLRIYNPGHNILAFYYVSGQVI